MQFKACIYIPDPRWVVRLQLLTSTSSPLKQIYSLGIGVLLSAYDDHINALKPIELGAQFLFVVSSIVSFVDSAYMTLGPKIPGRILN